MTYQTKESELISVQQIRDDLNGFVDGLAEGKKYTILRRSKKIVSVARETNKKPESHAPGSHESIMSSLDLASQARKQAKVSLDPKKSYKELYYEDKAKQYGLS
ncbi:hypothetical protein A3F37_00715 [Candidatus Saccharibacteria bacterium RIFCSPHIGHO2_12_FULL_41_12]|nr:MAG: hypothetical protein A3F37_00715 [Candidatus Saccharibacteria bacterium RIFCSPHIGHO2_12_FULL_41_12]